jgi:hypothetical protein
MMISHRYKCKYNDLKKPNTYYVDSLGIVEILYKCKYNAQAYTYQMWWLLMKTKLA